MTDSTDDLRERLEAAKAKRAEVQAERDAEAEQASMVRELADLEKLEELEAQYGALGEGLAKVEIADRFTIFLRRGEKAHWAKLKSYGDKIQESHAVAFVKPHIVSPDVKTVVELADEYPIVWGACMEALNYLAGIRKEKLQGKS